MKKEIRIRANGFKDKTESSYSAELYLLRRILEKIRILEKCQALVCGLNCVELCDASDYQKLSFKELKDSVDDYNEWLSEGIEE